MSHITVVGGGFAGLVAAITAAEAGAPVRLYEAHASLGGRARATPEPYVAHQGPHVLYSDGPWWAWLDRRGLLGPARGVPTRGLGGFAFRDRGRRHRTPPVALLRVLSRRRRRAPVDVDFGTWVADRHGEEAARLASNLMGVATFDSDPGRLSAAFVWDRLVRVFGVPPPARYVLGGWNGLVGRLERRARDLGVRIEKRARVTELPDSPVVVATSLASAGLLLRIPLGPVQSGRAVLLDVAVEARRGDAFVVSDLDEAGWVERYSLPDPSLAPPGESLLQAQMPLRPGESTTAARERLERLLELAAPGWGDRLTWRREGTARHRTGALDLPGTTWRDRPAIDLGGGVYLAGDEVAAPGLLSEVSFHSGRAAGAQAARRLRRPGLSAPGRARVVGRAG